VRYLLWLLRRYFTFIALQFSFRDLAQHAHDLIVEIASKNGGLAKEIVKST